MGTSALHSVSVAAVITNDAGKVLLIQRSDNGRWEPPGGVLERHETVFDGLHREVFEETGLTVQLGRLTGVYKNMNLGVVALVFRATVVAGNLTMSSDEVTGAKWCDPGQVSSICTEAYAIRIADALADHETAIRAHDGVALLP